MKRLVSLISLARKREREKEKEREREREIEIERGRERKRGREREGREREVAWCSRRAIFVVRHHVLSYRTVSGHDQLRVGSSLQMCDNVKRTQVMV